MLQTPRRRMKLHGGEWEVGEGDDLGAPHAEADNEVGPGAHENPEL